MISFSLALKRSSTRLISASVSCWTSSLARFSSSAEMSLSLAAFLTWSLPSRRMLRMAVLWSSRPGEVFDGLSAALLGHGWDGDADDLAVVHGVEARSAVRMAFSIGGDEGDLPGRDEDELRLGRGDLRDLGDGRVGAVVVHLDLVEHVNVGAAGAGGEEVGAEVLDGLFHARLQLRVHGLQRRIACHGGCHRGACLSEADWKPAMRRAVSTS